MARFGGGAEDGVKESKMDDVKSRGENDDDDGDDDEIKRH
jgi:hypothetical protein